MEAFRAEQLTFSYLEADAPTLRDISFSVERGELVLLCGPSGCGKSTLLRQFKPSLSPAGRRLGAVYFNGAPVESLSHREDASQLGFVLQSPENSLVTDKVWHELAFGLESLGLPTAEIRRRVAELAAFFGLGSILSEPVSRLSGGQKQLVCLASALALEPEALLLDEPTGQLDPVAAASLIGQIARVNSELGITVIISEQRLEELFSLANRVLVLENGCLVVDGSPSEAALAVTRGHPELVRLLPTAPRLWGQVGGGQCPVSVRDGRKWLEGVLSNRSLCTVASRNRQSTGQDALRVKDVWFRYARDGSFVLRELSMAAEKGEFFALLGENGSGKTTALRLLAGLAKPERGKISVTGRVGLLPQDPTALFCRDTALEELLDVCSDRDRALELAGICGILPLVDRHPYDLSGGERQRLALAKLLLLSPGILLLDEPTKGLDGDCKASLGQLLCTLCREGRTVILVTHDVEFAAEYADRCALLFDGAVTAEGTPGEFFSSGSFYTTSAARMSRGLLPGAVTGRDILAYFGLSPAEPPADAPGGTPGTPSSDGPTSVATKRRRPPLQARTVTGIVITLMLIPLTILVGWHMLGSRKTFIISTLVLLEGMAPFFMAFEGRKEPRAVEAAVLSVMCALGVLGRAVFFMLPEIKPVMALSIVSGVAFGGEAGFITGAVTMLVSNMLFSQGPWTPWQMFAMGLTGFFAGVLSRLGLLRGRISLSIYGAAAAVFIYGALLNAASALLWMGDINRNTFLATMAAGIPMDLLHGLATAVFLWVLSEPMLKKLNRVKVRFGIAACDP